MYSSDHVSIEDNLIRANGYYGIYLYNESSNNTVQGNTCNDNLATGIFIYLECNNNTVQGNTCNGNSGIGIEILQSCSNNNIRGNTCSGNGVGISVDTTGVGNNVSANTVGSTSGNSDWIWFVAGFVILLASSIGDIPGHAEEGQSVQEEEEREVNFHGNMGHFPWPADILSESIIITSNPLATS